MCQWSGRGRSTGTPCLSQSGDAGAKIVFSLPDNYSQDFMAIPSENHNHEKSVRIQRNMR
ncbi:hypothetical protein KDA_09320 [Dictyobacter alpinus]|uniref:Uncharacterized protein n=1 Tax=Dictyobacter alpinus TaxID=2014873 RepID=A0A402B295_9CHLR|nr:hypothetical protein KDA_09320 [Dictyobacter alpinus]